MMGHDDKNNAGEVFDTFQDLTLEEAEVLDAEVIVDDEPPMAPEIEVSADDQETKNGGEQLPAKFVPHKDESTNNAQGKELKVYSTDIAKTDQDSGDDELRKKGRIGDRLVSMGLITEDQLNVAIQEKKISNKMLGEVMVDLGFIDEDTLSAFLAEESGFELFDPQSTIFDGEVLALFDKDIAVKHQFLPVSMDEQNIMVAMADPYDVVAIDTMRRFLPKGVNIKPMVCTAKILSEAIDAAYGYASSVTAILQELEEGKEQNKDN